VLGQPANAQPFRQLVKGVLGKGGFPLLLVGAGDGTGLLPGQVGSHAAQAALPFGEHSIIELPPHLQVGTQACGLPGIGEERQFELKPRRLLFGRGALLPWPAAHYRLLPASH
jgi:hypothetical protein